MCNGFVFQVSNCQWTLDITVFVIDMKYAEKKDEKFCCCDTDKCEDSLSTLGTCEKKCDILFHITVAPCTDITNPGPCSVFTDDMQNAENIDDYGFSFHFTTTAPATDVRKCSFTPSMGVCMFVFFVYVCLCVCVCVCV